MPHNGTNSIQWCRYFFSLTSLLTFLESAALSVKGEHKLDNSQMKLLIYSRTSLVSLAFLFSAHELRVEITIQTHETIAIDASRQIDIPLESTQKYLSETSTCSCDHCPESKRASTAILDTARYKGCETHRLVRRTSSRSISLDEAQLWVISAQVTAFLQLYTSATVR